MPTIFDMFYREYCRARLAEMRKQLLIPIDGDEIPEAYSNSGDLADLGHRGTAWVEVAGTRNSTAQPSRSAQAQSRSIASVSSAYVRPIDYA
jgi:hypothetical protein